MGNNKQTEEMTRILDSLLEGKTSINVSSILTSEALDELMANSYVLLDDRNRQKVYTITEQGKQFRDFQSFKELNANKLQESKEKDEANHLQLVENKGMQILSVLRPSNGSEVEVDTSLTLEALKHIVKEDLATFEDIGGIKHYTITEQGIDYLRYKNFQITKEEENEIKIRESYIGITYKKAHDTIDLIEDVTEKFILESDGIPVIQVAPENYKKILDRTYNEHWHKYVGVGASKLIKHKKLNRFYVENTETKRKYLYIVPSKKD